MTAVDPEARVAELEGALARVEAARSKDFARVVELERVEDSVFAFQRLVDAARRDEAVERLMTIYAGGAMKRDLGMRTLESGAPTEKKQ